MAKLNMKRVYYFLAVMASLFLDANLYSQPSTTKAQLNHIALYVVNLQASINFYHSIVGLDTIPEPFHDGKHAWFQVGPNSTLHLIQGAIEKESHNKIRTSALVFYPWKILLLGLERTI